MLLRRNIVIDVETAQLVAAAVQAALKAGALPGRRAGARVFPVPIASRCSDNGSRRARHLVRLRPSRLAASWIACGIR